MKESERSLQFKKHFDENRDKGMSIPEMARKYGLSSRHAYTIVRQIADAKGVSYDSLLQQIHPQHILVNSSKHDKVAPIDLSEFRESSQATISSMNKTLELMDQALRQWPTEPKWKEFKEEEK